MRTKKKSMLLPEGYCSLQARLGLILKVARDELGLSQLEVAEAAKISRETLCRIEAGRRPRPQVLTALMEILHLEECDVFVAGENLKPLPHVPGSRGEQLASIGKSIKEGRAARKLSLHEAAKQTGISAPQLSRIERGLVCRSRAFADDPGARELSIEHRLVDICNPELKALADLN